MNRLWAILGLLWCFCASAAEVMPPSPPRYFNNYANVVSAGTVDRLNKTLEDFEKQTSSQIVVAVYPKMQTDSSIDDYAQRIFRLWKVGQKDKNNGAILLVFVQDHKMRIQTGYGLEGALPDSICKRIIDQEIAPRFKQGDFDGGLSAGVTAMLAATKGEYKGNGRTVANPYGSSNAGSSTRSSQDSPAGFFAIFFLIIMVIIVLAIFSRFRGGGGGGGWIFLGGGGGGGGGGWSGGGGGGDGGGFSGGGGDSGGGGASGGW